MFEYQFIADGANIFITIVAVLIGFGAALGVLDLRSSKKKEENNTDH